MVGIFNPIRKKNLQNFMISKACNVNYEENIEDVGAWFPAMGCHGTVAWWVWRPESAPQPCGVASRGWEEARLLS